MQCFPQYFCIFVFLLLSVRLFNPLVAKNLPSACDRGVIYSKLSEPCFRYVFKHVLMIYILYLSSPTRYKKTQETLSVAGQKTTAAFSTMGTALSRKLGDMRYRPRHKMAASIPFSRARSDNHKVVKTWRCHLGPLFHYRL